MLHRMPPEIFEAHLASEVLGFGTGLALSALLLGLLRRGAGKQPDARARYYQATAALMFNLGGLLVVLLTLFGARDQQALFLTVTVMHFSGAAFFPSAFLALWRKSSDEQIDPRESLPFFAPNFVHQRSYIDAEFHCDSFIFKYSAGWRCLRQESDGESGSLACRDRDRARRAADIAGPLE